MWTRILLAPVLLAFAGSASLFGQFTTASLGGTVSDPSGASVPETRITVRNLATGFTQSTVSGATGVYLFSRLPIGGYEMRVEKAGFGAFVQSGIRLTVDQMATQNVTLTIGQVTEQVSVQAEAELIATRTATGGQLVDQRQIRELPLQGRRPERLLYLAAGTVTWGGTRAGSAATAACIRARKQPALMEGDSHRSTSSWTAPPTTTLISTPGCRFPILIRCRSSICNRRTSRPNTATPRAAW